MSGTTDAQWWKADPMASATPPPSPAATDAEWWKADPMGEPWQVAPEMGGIIDDPARAAPARVIANASLFPNTADKIKVYSKALGVPASEFGMVGDALAYRNPQNPEQYIRVEPSVTGATGVGDAAKRVGLYAAGSVGPAIPAVAGMLAGAATRSPGASIAAATAGGGAGDVLRQGIGQAINGGNPTDIDWLNVAGQAALGGVGQGAAVGGRALFNRVPAGLAAADQEWMRNPANVAGAQANADLLRQQGITGMNGAVTDRGSLIAADRQMMRNANTADPMRATVRRINTDEVPGAVERTASSISPNGGIDQAARRFREAADAVIEAPRTAANASATPSYRAAEGVGSVMSPDLIALESTPAVRDVMPAARKTYENLYGKAPDQPDFRLWDLVKKELDARYDQGAVEPSARAAAKGIDAVRKRLTVAMEPVYPTYAEGRAIARPGMQASETLREGMLGGVANAKPDAPAHQILAKAFSPSHTTPAAIAESRTAFMNAGQVDAWDGALSGYIRSVSDTAQKSLANGETGNVAGKIHAELFGTGTKREAMAAAMGGKDTPAFKQFAETMRALEIAARVPAMGSQTATDLGQVGAVAGPGARGASGLLKAIGTVISPLNWGAQLGRLGDRITDSSASKAALATANRYNMGPELNGAALDAVRVMSPTVYGLLGGASRAGVGILPGLLGAAGPKADWQPYQPLRPGP